MTTSKNTDPHERCAFYGDNRFHFCEGEIVLIHCECCNQEILSCEYHADDEDIRWTATMLTDGVLHQ